MDIDKCYEILEVNKSATPDQVKQAYKDLVNIWHPDRVSNNPRLKQKAEDKLKEINTAYEKVNLHLSSLKESEPKSDTNASSYPGPYEKKSVTPDQPPDHHDFQSKAENRKKSERVPDQDQSVFSNLWSAFSSLFRQMFTDMQSRMDRDSVGRFESPKDFGMGKGGDRCMGGGKGMGRGRGNRTGKGGMGRGRGR
jgi:curved DNA-binding protein CbpA